MKQRLLGWLGRGGSEEEEAHSLARLLKGQGISQEALTQAREQRHLRRTRLVSSLSLASELSEAAGVDVLSRHVGLPGLCLGQSVVDLSIEALPANLALERLILPVSRDQAGRILVATTDGVAEDLRQDLELLLGAPIRPHVALHHHLRRAVRACLELRKQREDAAFLLGEEIEPDELNDPADHVSCVVLESPVPEIHWERASGLAGELCVLVGTGDLARKEQLGRAVAEEDCYLVWAAEGPAVLRLAANETPDIIALDAQLSGRSGVEILTLLAGGERFRHQRKILAVPESLPVHASRFGNVENLVICRPEEVLEKTAAAIEALRGQTRVDQAAVQREARAAYYAGKAQLERDDRKGALEHLAAALEHDPVLPEAHKTMARLRFCLGPDHEAEAAFAVVIDLGVEEPEDLACLAELVQRRGDIQQAVCLWHTAAEKSADPEVATALRIHAESLLSGGLGPP